MATQSSRYFAPLGPTRLADPQDAPFILEMLNEPMEYTFRVHKLEDILYLIENSILSVCQLNPTNCIVGFIAVREYPPVPSLHPSAWEHYMWNKYKMTDMKGRNTLFVHLLCWFPGYSRELVDNMLKTIFMHDQYLTYICMMKFDLRYLMLMPGQGRAESSFRRIQAMERGVPGNRLPMLYVCDRKDVSPRLRVRRAVEEDNDDIVPIIERHSKRLRELYGDFYISELVSRHPESDRMLLVCEHNELAVGIMCLNTEINFENLEENFDLMPFGGLRRCTSIAPPCNKDTIDMNSFFSESCLKQQLESVSSFIVPNQPEESIYDEDGRITADDSKLKVNEEAYSQFMVLDYFDDDEDEVDFDIINIDFDLMRPDLVTPSDQVFKKILDGRQKELSMQVDEKPTKWEKKRTMSSVMGPPSKTSETVNRFTGTSNAFLLELFAVHPDYDERYGFDMLEVAFELFPNRDYCVMCLPSSQSPFPLLEHFVLCTTRCTRMRFINESLYVAHINSVRGDVSVRLGEAADMEHLNDVLEHASRQEALMELFDSTLNSRALNSYILLAQNQPIGLVVTGPLEDGPTIRTQYDLNPEPQRPGTDGAILAGVMSPVLEAHGRWYLREVMRHSPYSTLFWISQPVARGESSPTRNMMSLAERMIPVRPRRLIPNITGYKELDRIFRNAGTPFALWVMERPLSMIPKVYVNNKILVVGASRTGLAFLESLIMGPASRYLTFTNLNLVSESGLPRDTEMLKAASTCSPRDGRYTENYLKSIPFCFYVDVTCAVMVAIDRKKKCIYLKGGGTKYYDELVITCGQQFQHPEYLQESLELVKELEKGKPCERMLMDNPKYQPDRVPPPPELPENVMLINSLHQANICLKKLLRMMGEEKNGLSENAPVVVYGDCIEAYSCMAALLELGIPPTQILFVEPFPPEDLTALRVNCFNDERIDERVQEMLETLGIRVLRRTRLMKWNTVSGRVKSLRLISYLNCTTQNCFAMFYYGLKAIDLYAFKAINDCGLVYDGGLIVGPTFETNDPAIYAAGTCIRYSRRLYASLKLHKYYSSEDIGDMLAQLFLEKFDPFIMCNTAVKSDIEALLRFGATDSMLNLPQDKMAEGPRGANNPNLSRRWQPVIKFDSPIQIAATLPGPLYYMKIRKPGFEIPMEVQLSLPHQGHTLETNCDDNYFRLELNVLHVVDAVTCLSHKQFNPELFTQLYGKHEAFFDKLLLRFQTEHISDLFELFTMPWLSAFYHESFDILMTEIYDQDIDSMAKLLKTRYSFTSEKMLEAISSVAPSALIRSSCILSEDAMCSVLTKSTMPTTFHSLLKSYVANHKLMDFSNRHVDIPTECGQPEALHKDLTKFWETIEGERIILAQIAQHISKHAVSNPHYAAPDPSFV